LLARSADYPDGYFLGWTPGQIAPLLPEGFAWPLDPNTDLVLEIHFMASGRPEVVAPSVGFYFSDDPPERTPTVLRLGRQNIDIPAGERSHIVTDSYVLPVDVDVLALQPHAHYLAREITGSATLPDGTTKRLIYIKEWDFRWQHVYRYVTPLALPKGTTIAMRYVYDNSAENPDNPQLPPGRVRWGQRSVDEMGDLWVQVLTRDERDQRVLRRSFGPKVSAEDIVGYESRIQADPGNVGLRDDVALLYLGLNQPDRAATHFQVSATLQPQSAAAQFNLGTALMAAGRVTEAANQFQVALQINPDYGLAHNNLGAIYFRAGDADKALPHFLDAIRIDPSNAEAHFNVGAVLSVRGDFSGAIERFRETVRLKPDNASALANLAWLLATVAVDSLRDAKEAMRLAEQAADLTERGEPAILDVLAAAYAEAGLFERAVEVGDEALRLAPVSAATAAIRSRQSLYRERKPYRLPGALAR
jgi:tetratricopeptide (TPR) repeat protein